MEFKRFDILAQKISKKQDLMEKYTTKKIIIFEEIFPIHKLLIYSYILRGYAVYFIRLDRRSKEKKWVDNLIYKKVLKKIHFENSLSNQDGVYEDMAFDNIKFFSKDFADKILVERIVRLYKNEKIINLFHKLLYERLKRFYYLNSRLHEIQKRYITNKIIFIPGFMKRPFY